MWQALVQHISNHTSNFTSIAPVQDPILRLQGFMITCIRTLRRLMNKYFLVVPSGVLPVHKWQDGTRSSEKGEGHRPFNAHGWVPTCTYLGMDDNPTCHLHKTDNIKITVRLITLSNLSKIHINDWWFRLDCSWRLSCRIVRKLCNEIMIIYVCTIPVWTNKLAQYGNKLHKYEYMKHPFSVRYKMTGKKTNFRQSENLLIYISSK